MQTNRFNRQKDHCWEKQSKSKGFPEVCMILNCLPYSTIGILLILQQLKVRILLPWECVGWIFMRDTSVSFFSHRTSSLSSVCSFVSLYLWGIRLWVFSRIELRHRPLFVHLLVDILWGIRLWVFSSHPTSSSSSVCSSTAVDICWMLVWNVSKGFLFVSSNTLPTI